VHFTPVVDDEENEELEEEQRTFADEVFAALASHDTGSIGDLEFIRDTVIMIRYHGNKYMVLIEEVPE
jgi:hypothetical protein